MTDETGGRPEGAPERRLPVRRPSNENVPARSAERFSAPRQTRALGGLTSERAAKIVRQSGDARWIAFLGVAIVALFVIIYYFYELGAPFNLTTPRQAAEEANQQVSSVERGYNLYEANCARCHGAAGQGGIGPVLNDQAKLFAHLNEQYLKNVLTVGGRYVCGDPKSLMPVWADTNGGPLNYIQIEDLIAFIRAPSTQEFTKRDPELNEPVIVDGKVQTFKGWRNEDYKPEPSATPVPDCYKGDQGSATPGPAASLGPDATIVQLVAQGVAFDKKELTVPAGEAFGIELDNKDGPGLPHNVQIKDASGTSISDPTEIDGGQKITYVYEALDAGTYTFICRVHPIPAMTGTLTVE
jgi:mono/diheme cytochrome c family protein/plastocyanin